MNKQECLYITKVADLGSISKAAKELFVTQSSISQSLNKLEENYNVKIFNRNPRGMTLTEAGIVIYNYAEEILNSLSDLEVEMSYFNNLQKGHLIFGISSFLGSIILPDILESFTNKYPNISINIIENDTQKLEHLLQEGYIKVAILHSSENTTRRNIKFEKFDEDKFVVIAKKNLLKSSDKKLELNTLKEYDFILPDKNRGSRELINKIFLEKDFEPKIRFEISNFITIGNLVSHGLGISIIPKRYLSFVKKIDSIEYFYLSDVVNDSWNISIATLKNLKPQRVEKIFIEFLKKNLKKDS